jgi:hypothetical protein
MQANIFYLVLGHARYYSVSITRKRYMIMVMKVENTQVQMRKGILEFCILHIISRGEVYASDMLEELTSARIIVVEGTLYTTCSPGFAKPGWWSTNGWNRLLGLRENILQAHG